MYRVSLNFKKQSVTKGFEKMSLSIFDAIRHERDLTYFQEYLKSGKDINVVNHIKRTPLMCAVALNKLGLVNLLLEAKADVNKQDGRGWSALHIASVWNFTIILQTLLEHNANTETRKVDLHTPLHTATIGGYYWPVVLLLEAKAHVNVVDNQGETPIAYAKRLRHREEIHTRLVEFQNRHKIAGDVAVVFMGVVKKGKFIHKDLIKYIGRMIWETRNSKRWNRLLVIKKLKK